MDLQKLLAQYEGQLAAAQEERKSALDQVEAILNVAKAEKREATTPEEDDKITSLLSARGEADEKIARAEVKVAEVKRALADEEAVQSRAAEVTPAATEKRSYDEVARVGQEKRTYNPDSDRTGARFLADVGARFLRDPSAEVRLARHMQEERIERSQYLQRATTGNFSGLVLPQYLTELYAPATSNLRPVADICNKHVLPENGMTVSIGRVTTPTAVGEQVDSEGAAKELEAVTNQDIDDTLLTENVLTFAGQQTLSRQAIERGLGTEGVMLDDLFRRYATNLDNQLINRASVGLSALATSISYTLDPGDPEGEPPVPAETPSFEGLYPKILAGASAVEAAMLNFGEADYAIMHSRRWHWLSAQLGNKWPLVSQPGLDPRVGANNNGVGYNAGVRGILPNGLKVIVDNNVPTTKSTNQDEIYIVSSNELHLWEDPSAPVYIRAEEPKAHQLGVLYVLYGYAAFSFRRYSGAVQKVTGTGLAAPSF